METTYNTPIQPRQVRLELSSACNARCAVCHRSTMKRAPGFMDFEMVKKCVADIRNFPQILTEFSPAHYGEFLLNPEYQRIITYISSSLPHTRIAVATNGTLLDDEAAAFLAGLSNLKWLNISVNAFLPATYESFTGLPAENMEKIKQAILALKQIRPDIDLLVSMVSDSAYQSPKERELFIEQWRSLGVLPVIELAQYNNRPDRAPVVPVSLPCRSLFSDLVVLHEGQVISCCFAADPETELVVGDATKENLLDIWHSKRFNEIRNLHNAGQRENLPICRRCTFA